MNSLDPVASLYCQGKRIKFYCSNCKRDISNALRIQCAVCVDFHLCHDCFSSGVSLYPHENTHDYKVSDCLDMPVFVKDWSVNDELALLDGIDKFGMGNWKTIADWMGTTKTVKQVEDHYWELYMGVHGYCLPQNIMSNEGLISTADYLSKESSSGAEDEHAKYFHTTVIPGYQRGEQVQRDIGKEVYFPGKKGERVDIRDKIAALPGGDLPGFIPLRGDFDVEYENDAELMLADMEFTPDDHPSEKELKLQVIGIYNNRLDERNRRKAFVIERGLVDFKAQQLQERKRTKEERELIGKLRVFARFHSASEHDALIDGIIKVRRLRQQIELYQLYRKLGIRTLEQARQYETDRRNREHAFKLRKQQRDGYVYDTGKSSWLDELTTAPTAPPSAPATARKAMAVDVIERAATAPASVEKSGVKRRGRPPKDASAVKVEKVEKMMVVEEEVVSVDEELVGKAGRGRKSLKISHSMESLGSDSQDQQSLSQASSYSSRYNSAFDSNSFLEDPTIMKRAPGADLLSDLEIQLCSRVPMLPLHYLAAKDAIVREAYRNGLLTPEGVKRTIKMTERQQEVIYDFFVKELLINEPPPSRQQQGTK